MKKPKRKTLVNKLDKLFSQIVRGRGYCEKCGKSDDTLQTSHIYSRRYQLTRWNELNAVAMCAACHWEWHQKPVEGVEWLKEYYGTKKYNKLVKLASEVRHVPDNELIEMCEKLERIHRHNNGS